MKVELELKGVSVARTVIGLVLLGMAFANFFDAIVLQVLDKHIAVLVAPQYDILHRYFNANWIEGLLEIVISGVFGIASYKVFPKVASVS